MNSSSMVEFFSDTGYGAYPDLGGVNKALIIQLRNIGDVVLTEPLVGVLAGHLKQRLTIDYLIDEAGIGLLETHPGINKVHVLRRSVLKKGIKAKITEEIRLYNILRKERYDLVIALSSGSRTERCARYTNAMIRVGPKRIKKRTGLTLRRKYVYNFEFQPAAKRHYVDRNLDALRRIGINIRESILLPTIHENNDVSNNIDKILLLNGIKKGDLFLVVHPTSRWMFKCLPPLEISGLIDLLSDTVHVPIILTSGPDSIEKRYIERVKSNLHAKCIDLSGRLTLVELSELIRKAGTLISVDTAPLHISEAVNTPVIAYFGPTFEQDWGPRSAKSVIITSANYACRPCGYDGCGGGKISECLANSDKTRVVNFVKKVVTLSVE